MTYSSARAAVEDAGARARARGMIVTSRDGTDARGALTLRDSMRVHDWSH